MTPDKPSVAVLGTGIMGAPMAKNIAAAGMDTRVWNRTREKADALEGENVAVADTPAQAVNGADIVLTMLSDGNAVENVMTDGGALNAMDGDAVWLQMSTVGIPANERLAQLAEERGVTFVDAPVVGTKQPAEQGSLQVLASGPADAQARCKPVFDAVGSKTMSLGGAGEGTRLKLVINDWLLALVEGLAETVAFAERIDVDPATFLDAIDGGPVGPQYARLKGELMTRREFPPAFPLRLALKDANLVLEAAERHGVEPRVARVAAERFKRAAELGHADEDMAAVYYASTE